MIEERIKNLEKERLQLFEELNSIPKNTLNYNNNPKKWSINQHLYHTWLSETITEKYIRKKTNYPEYLTEMSKTAHLKKLVLKTSLNLGFKFKAPKFITEFPNEIDLNKLNKLWASSRMSFLTLTIDLKERKLDHKAVNRHPLLGRINMNVTVDFFEFHYNHHLKAVKLLKN
ncbi:MAG: hypothetical protein ACJ0OB_00785 [Flavobacteriaceae bacterium]